MTMTFVQVADAGRPGDRVTASGAPAYGTAQRVIVGIDDTLAGQAALRWAVITFAGDSQREAATALVRRTFRAVGGVPRHIARMEVGEGDPAVVLTQLAGADGDLLVLGDEHASSVHRIAGSGAG